MFRGIVVIVGILKVVVVVLEEEEITNEQIVRFHAWIPLSRSPESWKSSHIPFHVLWQKSSTLRRSHSPGKRKLFYSWFYTVVVWEGKRCTVHVCTGTVLVNLQLMELIFANRWRPLLEYGDMA